MAAARDGVQAGPDLRSRGTATVAALTALGNAAPQLRVHVGAALSVGLNGPFAAEEVFAEG